MPPIPLLVVVVVVVVPLVLPVCSGVSPQAASARETPAAPRIEDQAAYRMEIPFVC